MANNLAVKLRLPGFKDMQWQVLAGPVLILMILSMMVLPLPPFMLDLFFTFNIAISVIVMLVAINVLKPLDFSVFPTVLLITTLLRLSLNVASTRVVLLEGHTGPGAAGQVIEAVLPLASGVAVGVALESGRAVGLTSPAGVGESSPDPPHPDDAPEIRAIDQTRLPRNGLKTWAAANFIS